MAPLVLALHLALGAAPALAPAAPPREAPSLAPRLDPGPFRSGELALASVGVLAGDALVLGGGYLALTLFANGTFEPNASNFRTAAYVLGAAALLVPPLAATGLARLGVRGPLAGSFWTALLLATAGQAAALAAGYLAAPHLWLVVPVQLATVSLGTSYGLHRGARRGPPAAPARASEAGPPDPPPAEGADARAAARFLPLCPDA